MIGNDPNPVGSSAAGESSAARPRSLDEVLHLCHVGPYPSRGGGISAVTASLVERQRSDPGLSIELFPTSVDGGRLAKTLALIGALRRLDRRCRRRPLPLLHVHASSGMSFRRKARVLRIAARRGVPCLLHVHSGRIRPWYEDGSERHRQWVRRRIDLATHVVALSESWKRYLETITSKPVTVVPNAVDVERFAFERDYTPSGRTRLLLLGGVGLIGKGARELIEVVDTLNRDDTPTAVSLDIVGHGEVEEVRRHAAERGLQETVKVTGWVEKEAARDLIRRADVFVLPSRVEGLPVSMLEAMASGLPVVVTPVGGIPEVVEDGTNGLVVRPGDTDELGRALRRLLTDAELRRRLGERARETIRERFDIRAAVARFSSLYLGLRG